MRYAACIFDLDGTLVDSMPQHLRAYERVLEPLGAEVLPHDVYLREGMNARDVVREILEEQRLPVSVEEARRLGKLKQETFRALGRPPLAPGAERCLARLADAGLRLAVVTGTSRENAAFVLGPLAARFAMVIADGDYQRPKPDPQPYVLAAQRLGLEPARCVVVENAPLGVRAGVAAGMSVIAVPTTMAPERLLALGAGTVAGSLDEVADLVLGQAFKAT